MRAAGKLAAQALKHVASHVKPGLSTGALDDIARQFIIQHNATPASLNYKGFPKSICTSMNNVVCHGIPSYTEILKDGDIINLDVAVILDGWYGDNSQMCSVGVISDADKKLIDTTELSLVKAIEIVKPGIRTRDIGAIIEDVATSNGCTSVQEFVGHGIGENYHEDPQILHYRNVEPSVRLQPGMIFTIEPMLNAGSRDVILDDSDGWTVRTRDGNKSAQFEHTILVTETGFEILTVV
jgi:methionyl aminopeptidase